MTIITPVNPDVERIQFECRFLRHAWEIFAPPEFRHDGLWRRAIHIRCLRCGTERHDALDTHGELITRRYAWPDEYRMGPDERPTAEELRLWMFKKHQDQKRHRGR